MADRKGLEAIFLKAGFEDFKWINPRDIVVAQWVRLKCAFGCPGYGKKATCPPNTPSVADCREFFQEYDKGVIFHFPLRFDNPEDRHPWMREINRRLIGLEREIFIAGYQKAFMLFADTCSLCGECGLPRAECRNAGSARPSAEAMAIDVFGTVRQYGLPIEVVREPAEAMNRYAFLLLE